jgi:hypothetical protein
MRHPDLIWTIAVGFTTVRPVIPEQDVHHVQVSADSEIDARLIAYAMVYGRRGVVMVTSVSVIECIA